MVDLEDARRLAVYLADNANWTEQVFECGETVAQAIKDNYPWWGQHPGGVIIRNGAGELHAQAANMLRDLADEVERLRTLNILHEIRIENYQENYVFHTEVVELNREVNNLRAEVDVLTVQLKGGAWDVKQKRIEELEAEVRELKNQRQRAEGIWR